MDESYPPFGYVRALTTIREMFRNPRLWRDGEIGAISHLRTIEHGLTMSSISNGDPFSMVPSLGELPSELSRGEATTVRIAAGRRRCWLEGASLMHRLRALSNPDAWDASAWEITSSDDRHMLTFVALTQPELRFRQQLLGVPRDALVPAKVPLESQHNYRVSVPLWYAER